MFEAHHHAVVDFLRAQALLDAEQLRALEEEHRASGKPAALVALDQGWVEKPALLAAGVPILTALQITREAAGNLRVAEAIRQVHDRVREGESVARPLEATNVFPSMVPGMIDVGEETGRLPDMLERIADTYDDEVDNAVAALTALLEPLMIVVMALVVGTIVIALFLPLARIVQSLS